MKHAFILISIVICVRTNAQTFNSENKNITDGYVEVTAGTANGVKVGSFYISSTEISNKQYREFLNDLRKNSKTEELKQATVDTAKWKHFGTMDSNQPFVDYYFQHKSYDEFPVVNISKRGAELYCEWLTEKYNRKARRKVKFALPTEAQWILAARGGNGKCTYPWEGSSITYEKKGKYYGEQMCNYRVEKKEETGKKESESVDVTAVVVSYMPNGFGIYNMSGNVSELIADKEITKGGSWNSKADKMKIESLETYADVPVPSPAVGFRPMFVVE